MSLPYLLLSAAPGLVKRIPRPGRWMETLKQAMGFPMMAAVVWMGSVLIALSGAAPLLSLLAALGASGIGAWVWGRWGGIDRPRGSRRAAAVIALALIAGGAALAIRQAEAGRASAGASGSALPAAPRSDGVWEAWSPERVAELRAAGRPVFIDFSAQWCLTCQVNERVALRREPVERRFRELGVAALKADWTDRSDSIAAAIAGYGRAGVPLYVLYGPAAQRPILLPEVLTPRIVLDALAALRLKRNAADIDPPRPAHYTTASCSRRSLRERSRALRTVPDGFPAHRGGSDGTVQLSLRPVPRRDVHPPH
jgi:thiol:disulfide interchange protein